jgi:hypothetical protein
MRNLDTQVGNATIALLRHYLSLDVEAQNQAQQALADLGLRPLLGGRNNKVFAWDTDGQTLLH